jgi:hypothetical protein
MDTSWTINNQVKRCVDGIPYEYFKRIEAVGGIGKGNDYDKDAYVLYDSVRALFVINEMYADEPNAEVLLLTMLSDVIKDGEKIKGIIIENKTGRQVVYGKQFVDCTGDCDLLSKAGSRCDVMDPKKQHPASLIAKVCNVDTDALVAYYKDKPELQKGERYLGHLPHSGFYNFRLAEELKNIALPKEMEYLKDWFVLYYTTPNPHEIILNMTGITGVDGTDAKDVSRGTELALARIWQIFPLFRKYIVGFKDAYLAAVAPTLGIRESRKVRGEVKLTADMLMGATKFPDAIVSYQSPLGYHTPDGKNIEFHRMQPGSEYDIPLRSVLPSDVDGIIVAGRNISVESNACGSTRSMTNCMSLGQAAGVIASLAAHAGKEIRELSIDEIQKALVKQHVYICGHSEIE